MNKILTSETSKDALSIGKWIALISSLGVILGYGSQFGVIVATVKRNTEMLDRHSQILTASDNWKKTDHTAYADAVERRISSLEMRTDTYMTEIRNRIDKIYEKLSK